MDWKILGAGMVHPNVLKMSGIDPENIVALLLVLELKELLWC